LRHGEREEDDRYSAESEDVDVVDTIGAVDALTGAYLAYRGKERGTALRKAVKAASLSTKSKGATASLPRKSELE